MGGEQVDLEKLERDWTARGFTFGRFTDLPGQEWAGYEHTTDEIMMLVEGAIEVRIGNDLITPAAGEEVNIPAGLAHTVRNVGTDVAKWVNGYKRMQRGGHGG